MQVEICAYGMSIVDSKDRWREKTCFYERISKRKELWAMKEQGI
jgi:hypothetical protein